MTLDSLLTGAPARSDMVVSGAGRFSSGELEGRVRALVSGLAARGVEQGDRVAFRLPTGVDGVVVYRACWRIGAVAVALHPAAGSHQLNRALVQARPVITIAGPDFPPTGSVPAATIDELTAEAGEPTHTSRPTQTCAVPSACHLRTPPMTLTRCHLRRPPMTLTRCHLRRPPMTLMRW